MSSSKGKFIILDGGEGSGKDTQIDLLKKVFQGDRYYFTREPGGTELAEAIRTFMLKTNEGKKMSYHAHFACAWAARVHHLETIIKPKLDAGIHVISNRCDSSTFAYQVYGQMGMDLIDAFWKMREGIFGAHMPDLYLWLHVSAEVSMERVKKRGVADNHFDEQESFFHQRVRKGFEDFFADKRVISQEIDGAKTEQEVCEAILTVLKPMIA